MYTILPRSNGPVLGVEITGKIGIEQEKKLIAAAEDLIEKHDKISVLIVLGDHASMSIEAATADVKWALPHMAHLHKVAIVADSKLIAALVAIDATFAKLAGIHEMHFATDEIETAWHWIEN